MFESLINAYELQTARMILTEYETEIADYDSYLQALQAIYIRSLELNESAEQRIGTELQRQLKVKKTQSSYCKSN